MAIPPIQADQGLARVACAQSQEQNRTHAVEEANNDLYINSAGTILRHQSLGEMVASRAGLVPIAFASSEISKDFQRLDRATERRKPDSDDDSREETGTEKESD